MNKIVRFLALLVVIGGCGWLLSSRTVGAAQRVAPPTSPSESVMGSHESFRAAMERYQLIREDLKSYAKSYGVKIKFGPLGIQVNRAGGEVTSATTPTLPDGGETSCTISLRGDVVGQSVEVSATASTCALALEEAESALKKAVMDLLELLRQIGEI